MIGRHSHDDDDEEKCAAFVRTLFTCACVYSYKIIITNAHTKGLHVCGGVAVNKTTNVNYRRAHLHFRVFVCLFSRCFLTKCRKSHQLCTLMVLICALHTHTHTIRHCIHTHTGIPLHRLLISQLPNPLARAC